MIAALRVLPGVGPRSAQRMALQLLGRRRDAAEELAAAITHAVEVIRECSQCHNYAEAELCALCASERRDASRLCVVESPGDVFAVEQTGRYDGRYFVLHGHLSPIDGIGPEELRLQELPERVAAGVEEVIVATNPTVEGEATAHYIGDLLQALPVKVSRIAHGVPVGGELEYLDGNTLGQALAGRRQL